MVKKHCGSVDSGCRASPRIRSVHRGSRLDDEASTDMKKESGRSFRFSWTRSTITTTTHKSTKPPVTRDQYAENQRQREHEKEVQATKMEHGEPVRDRQTDAKTGVACRVAAAQD